MEHIEVNDSLPTPIVQVLLALVDVAKRSQAVDVLCTAAGIPGEGLDTYDLAISSGTTSLHVTCHGHAVQSLEQLGLIGQKGNTVFLYPAAFKRAKYERKNPVGKWIERTVSKWRDTIVVLSFVVSAVAVVISIIKP